MSTFDGKVAEFPEIRIDYFRTSPGDAQLRSPLAYFLSHVHSDHLVGLESCKSPFIYCSPATRDVLLRLEKFPHRMNFAKGILETRQQTYRHLKNLLKAIPLETPTVIELAPGKEIRVTLFDANHCVGAVMFLIEASGKAVLYTGDIRAELWWVNSLTRHPILLPYLSFALSKPETRLDSIYLDTTFVVTGREDPYKHFPSKAEGLKELLEKVSQYPKDTLFYFDAWTFGYEDVWQALSNFLGSRIHMDDYRWRLYRALANGTEPKAAEAAKLVGFYCGNHHQDGCLTRSQCKIHSCERGTGCEIWSKDFVRITPIVSRYDGVDMPELGPGGGQGDLNQQHELEVGDNHLVGQLMALCASKLGSQTQLLSSVLQMLTSVINNRVQSITLDDFDLTSDAAKSETQQDDLTGLDEMPLEKLVPALARIVTKSKQKKVQAGVSSKHRSAIEPSKRKDGLPERINFPYSRHSSYNELCLLIEAFKPKNIHPCTVDEAGWSSSSSMSYLFGHLYNIAPSFSHDQMMLRTRTAASDTQGNRLRPESASTSGSDYATPNADHSVPMINGGKQETKTSSRPGTAHSQRRDSLPKGDKLPDIKRKRSGRKPQGDFWPPPVLDHYSPSPPDEKRRRPSSMAPTLDEGENLISHRWPDLSHTDTVPKVPVKNRWHERIAESVPPQWRDDTRSTKRQDERPNTEGYGRLSPPVNVNSEQHDSEDDYCLDESRHRRLTNEVRDASLPRSSNFSGMSPSVDSRMALRREAFNAALSSNGALWSDIGIVSIDGHQAKEEEL